MRKYTNKLLELMDNGEMNARMIADAALHYLSEDQVKELCQDNDWSPDMFPEVEGNPVKDSYENGVCPDCGEDIPDDVDEGEDCSNCGHTFYANHAND